MATGALTSGSWTIAHANGDRSVDTSITNRKKVVNLKLTLDSGIMPLAGVPMPGAGSVGMVRNLDFYLMSPRLVTASGIHSIVYALTTGHRMLARRSVIVSGANGGSLKALATTFSNPERIFYVQAIGW